MHTFHLIDLDEEGRNEMIESIQSMSVTLAEETTNPDVSPRPEEQPEGDHLPKNQPEKRKKKKAPANPALAKKTIPAKDFRFQLRLVNGVFTKELMNLLVRDLHQFMYSRAEGNSFMPSFRGHGLRYGLLWFSPENENSYTWLIHVLGLINDKATSSHKFIVEEYNLYQTRICFTVHWDVEEKINEAVILTRLDLSNPVLQVGRWKHLSTRAPSVDSRQLFCSIDKECLKLLEQNKFRGNYGIRKVMIKMAVPNKAKKPQA